MPNTLDTRRAWIALALVFLPCGAAHAQWAPGPRFGVSAGLTVPLNDLSRSAQTGYRLDGFAIGTPYAWPVALRGDLSYSAFSGTAGRAAQNFTGISASAVYPMAKDGDTPYVIGGLGLYHESAYAGFRAENDLGMTFGGGYQWRRQGLSYFVELRYVYVSHTSSSRQMMPLVFGVRF